ncbi:MAG: DUF5131 family protein [Pseudomonadota bacterium]
MAENTLIEWADATWNPWQGCTVVGPGCANCYAARIDKRFGGNHWGPRADRKLSSEANWRKPFHWNAQAAKRGKSMTVFCASMADIFDDHPSIKPEWRDRVFETIQATQNLTWLLLTKRPDLIWERFRFEPLTNVMFGVSIEDQKRARERLFFLSEWKAWGHKTFISYEPALGAVKWKNFTNPMYGFSHSWRYPFDWAIAGGESGPGARKPDINWFRDLRDLCVAESIPFFFKQWGIFDAAGLRVGKKKSGRLLDGVLWDQRPS